MDYDIKYVASLVVAQLTPELYEDEVYLWEIASVMRYIASQDSKLAFVIDLIEHDAEFIKKVTMAVVGQILMLPGIETHFTGWPFDGDWQPRRATMPANDIIETIRTQLEQLGREPVTLEIAFFRGVEGI